MNSLCETSDLLVFSDLGWDSALQRPQQLLSRQAKYRRVYYVENPEIGITKEARLHIKNTNSSIKIFVPYLPNGLNEAETNAALKILLDELILEEGICDFTSLYLSSKALSYTRHLEPNTIIFDRLNNHSQENEDELIARSHLIFTNGNPSYKAHQLIRSNVHSLPSSVDFDHFSQSRMPLIEPDDQINIPHPRIGFYGTIDDKFNINLLKKLAEIRPEFHFILMGPIDKIALTSIEVASNVHYLGNKDYHALPLYLSSWDCTFMPYHLSETSSPMSTLKTSEFLAAGKPVVSTSIPEVVHPYADAKIVYIADHPEHFVECIERGINESSYDPEWLERVDHFLEASSWDATFNKMAMLEKNLAKVKHDFRIPAYLDHSLISIGIV